MMKVKLISGFAAVLAISILSSVLATRYYLSHSFVQDAAPLKTVEVVYKNTPNYSPFIDLSDVARQSLHSVVYVLAYQKISGNLFSDGYRREKGSGVILSRDGYIVTNLHVIKDASFIEITLEDKREFVAEVIGSDATTDLALLKIEASDLRPLDLIDSDQIRVGEWVLAIGNPFGLQSTVTAGIISATSRNVDNYRSSDTESYIQTDAVINPGSSGGALISSNGQLVGICSIILSSTGNYEGMSFAVPSNIVKKVIDDLRQFGSVQRGQLGVTVTDVNAGIAHRHQLPSVEGVFITNVSKQSAADKAGITTNDIILSINDIPVNNNARFFEIINKYHPGDQLEVLLFRKGKKLHRKVILQNHLNTTEYLAIRSDRELKKLGIEVRDLSSEERKRLNKNGVLVVSVLKDSPIAETNMEPGYIIQFFNDEEVKSTQHLLSMIKSTDGDITVIGFYERYPGRWPYTFNNFTYEK